MMEKISIYHLSVLAIAAVVVATPASDAVVQTMGNDDEPIIQSQAHAQDHVTHTALCDYAEKAKNTPSSLQLSLCSEGFCHHGHFR